MFSCFYFKSGRHEFAFSSISEIVYVQAFLVAQVYSFFMKCWWAIGKNRHHSLIRTPNLKSLVINSLTFFVTKSESQLLNFSIQKLKSSKCLEVWTVVWFCVVWSIWLWRNSRIFHEEATSMEMVVELVKRRSFFWIKDKIPSDLDQGLWMRSPTEACRLQNNSWI